MLTSIRDADGTLLRQVNAPYGPHYEQFMDSGLYQRLVDEVLLIPHEEVGLDRAHHAGAVKILAPEPIPFISYPYEWCTGQLQDAALLTLRIQTLAMEHGMSLKDASAYNVQFRGAAPVFIDTLSFEPYGEGRPWVAYGQFCRHFLAPLALMSHTDVRLGRLLRFHTDGIPLDLASRLLPVRTRLSIPLLLHIHLHASYAKRAGRSRPRGRKAAKLSRRSLDSLVQSLHSGVSRLRWRRRGSYWADYYSELHDYQTETAEQKARLVIDAASESYRAQVERLFETQQERRQHNGS